MLGGITVLRPHYTKLHRFRDKPNPNTSTELPLAGKAPRAAYMYVAYAQTQSFWAKSAVLAVVQDISVWSGYFEYLHALRDLSCPSSVLSDGTKPQPLEMPGSGCKLHLKWAEHQKWRQPYTVRTV